MDDVGSGGIGGLVGWDDAHALIADDSVASEVPARGKVGAALLEYVSACARGRGWVPPVWLAEMAGLLERCPGGGVRGLVGVTVRHGKTSLLKCAIAVATT